MNDVRYSPVNLMRVAQSLPATPRIMARLGQLLRDPTTGLGEIADQLKHDSALAARLLRIANSAAFAQSEPVASIEDAAALIGMRDIHRLIGAVAVDHFSLRANPLYGFTGPRLRDNAIMTALLMEELAAPAQEDPAAAYAAGLFRSLGKVVLTKLAEEHGVVAPFQPAGPGNLIEWEKATFDLTSNQATAVILTEWHFPAAVTEAVTEHYEPALTSPPLAGLLNLAARLADQLGHGLPGESAYWREPAGLAPLPGVGPRAIQHASERAVAAFDLINRALG
ncbi:HDOD domain protein [Lacunisphaera limnophila]|uniref:HDOD domain protein n=1 Tax=Lacunisphaera limnophila TaxID=1838286 RepID=A0A1D8AV01_9BACT|nr:HDOD domain-containing protein [Lacunisphaera limnophila]AOS44711.1 HDOD domain protein [Lacunisphaera limnophila]